MSFFKLAGVGLRSRLDAITTILLVIDLGGGVTLCETQGWRRMSQELGVEGFELDILGEPDKSEGRLVGRGSKRKKGKKWRKVEFVHGLTSKASCDNSVNDSEIGNMKRIFRDKANVVVHDCRDLGFVFKEPDELVSNRVCHLIRED